MLTHPTNSAPSSPPPCETLCEPTWQRSHSFIAANATIEALRTQRIVSDGASEHRPLAMKYLLGDPRRLTVGSTEREFPSERLMRAIAPLLDQPKWRNSLRSSNHQESTDESIPSRTPSRDAPCEKPMIDTAEHSSEHWCRHRCPRRCGRALQRRMLPIT